MDKRYITRFTWFIKVINYKKNAPLFYQKTNSLGVYQSITFATSALLIFHITNKMIPSLSLSERPASATIYILGAFLSPLPAVGRSLYRHYVKTRLRILIPVSATDLEASRGSLNYHHLDPIFLINCIVS